jgi:hypothetical protein
VADLVAIISVAASGTVAMVVPFVNEPLTHGPAGWRILGVRADASRARALRVIPLTHAIPVEERAELEARYSRGGLGHSGAVRELSHGFGPLQYPMQLIFHRPPVLTKSTWELSRNRSLDADVSTTARSPATVGQ